MFSSMDVLQENKLHPLPINAASSHPPKFIHIKLSVSVHGACHRVWDKCVMQPNNTNSCHTSKHTACLSVQLKKKSAERKPVLNCPIFKRGPRMQLVREDQANSRRAMGRRYSRFAQYPLYTHSPPPLPPSLSHTHTHTHTHHNTHARRLTLADFTVWPLNTNDSRTQHYLAK